MEDRGGFLCCSFDGEEVDPLNVKAHVNVPLDTLRVIRERLTTAVPADSKTTCLDFSSLALIAFYFHDVHNMRIQNLLFFLL